MSIRTGIFVLLFGLAVSAAGFFPAGAYGEETVYVVQRGETFYSIAQVFGVKADALMKYNGITDPSRLQAGQRLKIPASAQVPSAPVALPAPSSLPAPAVPPTKAAPAGRPADGFTSYKAVRGDTLYRIAQKFSVSVSSILEANSLPANYLLKEGDSLRIPSESGILLSTISPVEAGSGGTGAARSAADTKLPAAARAQAAPQSSAGGKDAAAVKIDPSVRWPVAAQELSYMTGKLSGVVITATRAEPVQSLTWGTVLSAGPYRGFGKVAIIQVEGGYLYVYGGCESLSVKEGDKVGPGTELGKLGADVVTNKPQLFFMVYRSNTPIDPAKAPRA